MKDRYQKDMDRYEELEGWERKTLGGQLKHWAEKYRGKTALADEEEEITYEELNKEVDSLAGAFMDLGIGQGDNVIVQLPNRNSLVKVLFSLSRIGAVPVMALPAHREAEIEGITKLAEPSAYIVAEKYLGYNYLSMAESLKQKFSCLKTVIVDGEQGGDCQLSKLRGENKRFQEGDGYDTAVLLLSGGTTGVPKLIPRTHTDYIYNARMSAKRCGITEDSVYLASLPAAHNFPLCCPGLLGTLDAGGKVVLAPTTSPDDILTMITEEKVTLTALVPAMVNVCMEMMEWEEDYDISSLQVLQVGGAMLENTLADKIIREWPCKLMQVFGTAEGLLCFTGLDDSDAVVARCQGTPISPADEIKIIDEEGREVPDGTYGELLSRGPYTIDGYYRTKEANSASFTEDGFYRTGDRAMRTPEGNIRMGGRIKEQINRAGEKIMPAEVEAFLCRHGEIKEAAVVGVPDETLGHRTCAFLMTEDGKRLEHSAIRQFLKGIGAAAYKLPDQIEFVDSWPVTSVGKIDRKKLESRAQNQRQGEETWNIQR